MEISRAVKITRACRGRGISPDLFDLSDIEKIITTDKGTSILLKGFLGTMSLSHFSKEGVLKILDYKRITDTELYKALNV